MSDFHRPSRRKHHIIYKTTCHQTGRYYIGMHSTDDLEDGYFGSGVHLTRSLKKYGKEQHAREILERLPTREALKLREEEIVTEDLVRHDIQCMNLIKGGGGTDREYGFTEKTRRLISKAVRHHHASEAGEATRQKISEGNQGKIRTPEMRVKYSLAKKDIPFTDEHKKKLSDAKRGKPLSMKQRENHSNGQAGRCTIDGEMIYESKTALANALGHGKLGARSPSFRYIDETRYVQSDEQRHKTKVRMLGKPRNWKIHD